LSVRGKVRVVKHLNTRKASNSLNNRFSLLDWGKSNKKSDFYNFSFENQKKTLLDYLYTSVIH